MAPVQYTGVREIVKLCRFRYQGMFYLVYTVAGLPQEWRVDNAASGVVFNRMEYVAMTVSLFHPLSFLRCSSFDKCIGPGAFLFSKYEGYLPYRTGRFDGGWADSGLGR